MGRRGGLMRGRECLTYNIINNVFDGGAEKDGDKRNESCNPRE